MAKTETQIGIRVTWEFKEQLEAQAAKERRPVLEDYLESQKNAD